MSQQTAVLEQESAAARKALPIEARRQAARQMYGESVTAGMPMTAQELGDAFGRSIRWGRDRMTEVRTDLAGPAETAEIADEPQASDQVIKAEEVEMPAEPEAVEIAEAAEPELSEPAAAAAVEEDQGAGVRQDWSASLAALSQHRRVRWGVRATLALGVIASTVANVLHALDNPISQTIAAWPPLALLATIELISRVPVHRRSLAAVRFGATAVIASIAAWVSYGHMSEVISRYGETGASPYLIPLTVDGLVVVASVCLVELGSRIRALTAEVEQR